MKKKIVVLGFLGTNLDLDSFPESLIRQFSFSLDYKFLYKVI